MNGVHSRLIRWFYLPGFGLAVMQAVVVSLVVSLDGLAHAGDSIRVGTLNARNYLITDRRVDGVWRPNYPKPESEKAALRAAIIEVNADVLLLQEMGALPFLKELQGDLLRLGLDYTFIVHLQGPDEARHIALLSKLAPKEVVKHIDLDFKYYDERLLVKRGMLEVTLPFRGEDETLTIFGLHLKSRWSDLAKDPDSSLRRTREAQACRDRIIERTLEATPVRTQYLILGDFNDHPASAALRRFYSRGDLAIAERLAAVDSNGFQWTHFYEKHLAYTTVDGILIAPDFAASLHEKSGGIYDLLPGSDHRFVYADLVISENP